MKKTFYYLFAAIALLAAASCQKEIQPNDNNSSRGGEIITVVFDNSATKTTLDEGTPKWATGDVIWLSDGTNNSTVTVQAADNGKTSFSFEKPAEITGATLYAVYPSTAAVSIVSEKIQFTIPSEQDGKFSTANICVAKSTSTTLTFKNATAILQFGIPESGIKHIVVPATNITGKYEVATPGDAPTVVTGQGNNTVTLSPSESASAYYVAVAPVTIANKTDVIYKDVDWTTVGSNQTTSSKTLERSKIYDFGSPSANGNIPDGIYALVTTTPADWSGRYLLVCNPSSGVFKCAGGWRLQTAPDRWNFDVTTVTVTDARIEYSEAVAANEFTLEKSGATGTYEGSYYVKFGSYYIEDYGDKAYMKMVSDKDLLDDYAYWDVSLIDGKIAIRNMKSGTRELNYRADYDVPESHDAPVKPLKPSIDFPRTLFGYKRIF